MNHICHDFLRQPISLAVGTPLQPARTLSTTLSVYNPPAVPLPNYTLPPDMSPY